MRPHTWTNLELIKLIYYLIFFFAHWQSVYIASERSMDFCIKSHESEGRSKYYILSYLYVESLQGVRQPLHMRQSY